MADLTTIRTVSIPDKEVAFRHLPEIEFVQKLAGFAFLA
jgi:hypothetical protein